MRIESVEEIRALHVITNIGEFRGHIGHWEKLYGESWEQEYQNDELDELVKNWLINEDT